MPRQNDYVFHKAVLLFGLLHRSVQGETVDLAIYIVCFKGRLHPFGGKKPRP